MKSLSWQGFNDFVIALGYKGEQIREYFVNYPLHNGDLTVHLRGGQRTLVTEASEDISWSITLVDTGALTLTGGRLLGLRHVLGDERFLCTYGDGLADIDISQLMRFHESHGRLATVSTAQPDSRFGVLDIDSSGLVNSFVEKPADSQWVNIGFFVFEPGVFDYLGLDVPLETTPLQHLGRDRELMAFRQEGFWQPMVTYREVAELNSLWETGRAPWKKWP